MASTRQIRIYEDSSAHDITNILLEPSVPAAHGRSPLKSSQSRITPTKDRCAALKNVLLPPPEEMRSYNLSPSKAPPMNAYHGVILPIADTAVFGDLPPFCAYDQENLLPSQHTDNCAAFPDPGHIHAPLKPDSATTNTAASQSRKPKSTGRATSITPCLPEPSELPTPEDHLGKPNYSYASLIGMSILRAPNRRLQLSQIYKWISDTFSYYRVAKDGWKNSIRHNLSINKAFIKVMRPKDDPGKGAYWIIEPGMEAQFLKEKPSRRPLSAGGPTMKTFSQPLNGPSPIVWSTPADMTAKLIKQAPAVPEHLSSDGTIPASEPALHEDFQEKSDVMAPPCSPVHMSSPSSAIGSSPPLAVHAEFGEASPCLVSDFFLPPALPRTKKRKSTAMDDSGYFSCLGSSEIKSSANLEADRPRLKRGRAEEEIARIRSSSHDPSPTKGRSIMKPLTPEIESSSPFPDLETCLMPPPPLTPGLAFNQARYAPTSISPHTHLKNHRSKVSELLDPPLGIMDTLKDETVPSSVFDFDTNEYDNIESQSAFSLYADVFHQVCPRSLSVSPDKRTAHLPRQARSAKTSSAMYDTSSTRLNRMMMGPRFQSPDLESPIRQGSGTNHPDDQENDCSPTKGDTFDPRWFVDDDEGEVDESTGFDLTQGFPDIGRNQSPAAKVRNAVRPILGARSRTSRF
ncbi:MAG: hypothetical protein Q9198_000278 [Flavoplaca austrocitrina]